MKYTPAQDQQGEREQFVSDLFHALAQPLTGLRCSLEVALRRPALSAEEARSSLEQALQATERLYQSVLFVRQLAEAERTPPLGRVRLDEALRELHNEILPIGENLEVELSLKAPDRHRSPRFRGKPLAGSFSGRGLCSAGVAGRGGSFVFRAAPGRLRRAANRAALRSSLERI